MSLANCFDGLGFLENGHVVKPELSLPEALPIINHASLTVPIHQSVSTGANSFYGLSKAEDFTIPFKVDTVASSGVITDNSYVKSSSVLQAGLKKSPVSRPSRHLGPPPGFSHVSPKLDMESTVSDSISGNPIMDDYSWLDGYQLPSSTKALCPDGPMTYTQTNTQQINNNILSGPACFPFPGKLLPSAMQGGMQNGWHTSELLKAHHQQQLQPPQPLTNGNQHFTSLPEQFQGQSIWTGRYLV